MKNDQLCIASETIEQLTNFKDSINKLPFNNTRKLYYSNMLSHYELRIPNQNFNLDTLKLQIIAKSHQDILTKSSFNEYSSQIAIEAENRLMEIYEVVSQKIPQIKQNIHQKIIISVMNFKFHFQNHSQPRISLQDLLVTVQEMNLWQNFLQNSLNYVKYFYICLMWQYIDHQDTPTFIQIVILYANYLVKKIQTLQQRVKQTNQQINEILIDLLNCYNTFKLFKKHFNLQCNLVDQTQIYSLLYQVEYSLSQQIIYQYKKLNSKTKDEIVRTIKTKLEQNIIKFDQQSINTILDLLSEQHKNKLSKQRVTMINFHIKRKSSTDLLSETIKKRKSQNLKPINNIFVPRRVNTNLQLERKLQLKKQKESSRQKMGSSSSNLFRRSNKKITNKLTQSNTRNGQRQQTINNRAQQKTAQNKSKILLQRPTYESCKKSSTNKYEQMRMMICERNRGISLKINPHGQDINTHLTSAQKNNKNRKKRMPNRKDSTFFSNTNTDQKRISLFENDINNGELFPPLIRLIMNQYIKSFTTYFKYQTIKYTLPLYLYFSNLNKSHFYYLKGDIIRFITIEMIGTILRVVYTQNQKYIRTVELKVYEDNQQTIRSMFVSSQGDKKLSDFYKLGGILTYFSFNLKSDIPKIPVKLQISKIFYQQQIYTYNIYLTNRVNKNHYKKIMEQQYNFINKLDQELKIQYKYDKSVKCQIIHKQDIKIDVSLKELLDVYRQRNIHQWYQNFSIKLSLKIKQAYNIVTIKHLECIQTYQKYLFFTFGNTSKLGNRFRIIPTKKHIQLKILINRVSSWEDIKKQIITKRYNQQQSWTDLTLNRSLFQLKSTKYVIAKQPKGYEVLKSQILLQKILNLIKGQQIKQKWFILLNLSDIKGSIFSLQSVKSTSKIVRPKRNKSIWNPTFISIKSKNNVQNTQKSSSSPVRLLKKEGKNISIGKQKYKYVRYEYCWYMSMKQKIYYCFKLTSNVIMSLRIKNSQFIYIRNHSIPQQYSNDKQLVFKQFRRLLMIQLTQKWIVIGLIGLVSVARIINNTVVILIEQFQGKYTVIITSFELLGLSSIKLTHLIFNNKKIMERIKRIMKYKLLQKMIVPL